MPSLFVRVTAGPLTAAVNSDPRAASAQHVAVPLDTPLDCVCLSDFIALLEQQAEEEWGASEAGAANAALLHSLVGQPHTRLVIVAMSGGGGDGDGNNAQLSPMGVNLYDGSHEQLSLGADTLFELSSSPA